MDLAARATFSPTVSPSNDAISIPASQLEGPTPCTDKLPLTPGARGFHTVDLSQFGVEEG